MGPFLLGVYGAVSSRRIPRLLQYSTHGWFVYSAPLSLRKARVTLISAMKRFTTARMAAALLSWVPYERLRREVLFTNMTKYRMPPRDARKGPAVSMCTSSVGLLARAVV